jgi:dTDP-4-dehydrorhamnose reductase
VNPLGIYGHSKLLGEENALAYHDSIVVRTSWVFSSYGKNFVRTMMRLMKEKNEIRVVNDQFGCPTYAADLADALMKIIGNRQWRPGLYHFTNHGVTTWFEFAGMIREMTGSQCMIHPISTEDYPTPATRPRWSVLDHSKFSAAYDCAPRSWQDALSDCLSKLRSIGEW